MVKVCTQTTTTTEDEEHAKDGEVESWDYIP